jgi:Cu/Ag efflux protein CusF
MSVRFFATMIAAAALLSACAATQKPSGRMEDVSEARATVTAVDAAQRRVTLKEADGDELDVQVTDAVRNLDQIKPGDEVFITYTEALAWQVKRAGEGEPGVSTDATMSRAEAGEKPAGTVGRSVTVTATITAIDLAKGTVTITGPGGESRTIKARSTANLRKVQVGDLVDITYSEAVALAVRPVGAK